MDTQRLILFIIFSFSALFLWEAWQREHRPPLPPPTTAAKPAATADLPVPSAPAPGQGAAAGAGPVPGTPVTDAGAPAVAKPIVIKTDLYTADIDAAGGVIARVALTGHRDVEHPDLPYNVLQKTAERTFVAQSGLLGAGLPNHRTVYEALARPARAGRRRGQSRNSSCRRRRPTATRS